MSERRLPVYLLLDCSGSMQGEPIEAVRQGVKALVAELRGDPQALESAYLSVITFSSTAHQAVPLTELSQFQEPELTAEGTTAMGAAMRLLDQCVTREVRKNTPQQKGDWKPLVFLMTDGQPTDDFDAAATEIKAKHIGNIIACAAGSAADSSKLKSLTEMVIVLNDLQPDTLKAFFRWVSSSIKATSMNVGQQTATGGVALPPPPPQFVIVP